MVFLDGQKMSKSLGNLVFVDKLRTEWDPRAIRLAIIDNHYRRDWEWNDALMPRNTERLRAWKHASGGRTDARLLDDVRAALDDDLDTHRRAGGDRRRRRGRATTSAPPRRCSASTCRPRVDAV